MAGMANMKTATAVHFAPLRASKNEVINEAEMK